MRRVPLVRAASVVLVASALWVPGAAAVRDASPVACALLKIAELKKVLGTPASAQPGATPADCVFRGGHHEPVVAVANAKGTRGYRDLITAFGFPTTKLRGVGTEAVTYDAFIEQPVTLRMRGVIVRKASRVLQLSASGVGEDPPALPTVSQLVALARMAAVRL